MDSLIQAVGNPVTGELFWGREHEMSLFIQRIRDGVNQLLSAQRRMGKTSLMKEAARRLANEFCCLYVDFQDDYSPMDAITKISMAAKPYQSLWTKTRGIFQNILGDMLQTIEEVGLDEISLKLRAGLTETDWREKGDQLFRVFAAAATERPVLLLFDEIPILVNNILTGKERIMTSERITETERFVSWLRKNAIEHQNKLRIVLSGSIGLEPILHRAKISAALNNFAVFKLEPWDKSEAIGCLRALAAHYDIIFHEHAPEAIADKLGCCIPHHVQMFFAGVQERCMRKKTKDFRAEEVEEIYSKEMLSTRGHVELTSYEERLEKVLGKDSYALALDLLIEAAIAGDLDRDTVETFAQYYKTEVEGIGEVLKEIIWVLEHDGYLEISADRKWRFVSPLIRDWFKKRYENFFTPIRERI